MSVADATRAKIKVVLCVLHGDTRKVVEARMEKRGRNSEFVLGCESWENYESDKKRYQKISGTGIIPADHVIEVDTSRPIENYLPQIISFIQS